MRPLQKRRMGSIFYRGLSISYGQIGFIGFNRVIQFTEARSTAAFRIVHAGFTGVLHSPKDAPALVATWRAASR